MHSQMQRSPVHLATSVDYYTYVLTLHLLRVAKQHRTVRDSNFRKPANQHFQLLLTFDGFFR